MAAAGARDDESIAVVEEESSPEATVPGGAPEFRMYTGRGADDENASHYALNLSYQVLQRRNRELEQNLERSKREIARYRRRMKADGESLVQSGDMDESLSPGDGGSGAYRTRGTSSSDLAGMAELGKAEAKAQAEYIQYLEKRLQKCDAEREELSGKFDQEKARTLSAEQKHRKSSSELGECLEIVASRSREIEELTKQNEKFKADITLLQAQLNDMKPQKNIITVLNEKRRELEAKVFNLEGENATIHQLYEDTASKSHQLELRCSEYAQRQNDLTEALAEREEIIQRLRQSQQMEVERVVSNGTVQSPQSGAVVPRDVDDMDQDDNSGLLEETKRELSDLQQQVMDMHRVIRTQTGLIQKLANKLRQKAIGTCPLSGSPTPQTDTSSRPRIPELSGRGHQSDSGRPLTSPVLCDEDLQSLNTEISDDFRTLTEWAAGGSRGDIRGGSPRVGTAGGRVNGPSSPVLNKRGPVEQSNVVQIPSANMIPNLPGFSSRSQNVGLVNNRDTPSQTQTRPFNFSAQAVVVPRSSTEPLIRHPPVLGMTGQTQRSATEPLRGTNPFQGPVVPSPNPFTVTSPGAISREPNNVGDLLRSPQVVRLPDRASPGGDQAALPTQRRTPIEQSDLIISSSGPPKSCPICSKTFSGITQDQFEYHVNHCLDTSESAGSSPGGREGTAQAEEMRECPVCSQVYPPGISADEFESHVESHFVGEPDRFEVLGS